MIVSIDITPETQQLIAEHGRLADRAGEAIAGGLHAAAAAGAEEIRKKLNLGELGLDMQRPGSGLAASVFGWMLDNNEPLAAVGVPSNAPAAAYAGILEHGGTIRPVRARALAVPVSDEAKQYTSPRDQADLFMLKRPGKTPVLAESRGRGKGQHVIVHWVLMGSVTIAPRQWLSKGAEASTPTMAEAFAGRVGEYAAQWS